MVKKLESNNKYKKNDDDDDNFFQYAITAALNYNDIKKKICKEYQILNPRWSLWLERNRFSITLKKLEKIWSKQ